MEVIKNGQAVLDEEGDIVITELSNYATPLIRYRGLGDRGIISTDETGKRYLKIISGRIITDFVNMYNTRICSYAITEIIESYDEVMKFKIIQKSPEHMKIFIVAQKNLEFFSDGAKYYIEIKKSIENILKHAITLEIETYDQIKNEIDEMPFKVVERQF